GGVVSGGGYGYIGYNLLVASNSVTVSGTGSLWSNRLDLTVGNLGTGNRLEVNNGGRVLNSNGIVGNAGGNLALVTDASSTWSNGANLIVGNGGSASQLVVSNGASVFTGGHGALGFNSGANSNSVTVTDPGT